MSTTVVFHGSALEIKEPRIFVGRNTKDFGYGFYCALIREQAERWARRFSAPILNSYVVRFDDALKILDFPTTSEDWLDFIAASRGGASHDYDVVCGSMADDQIYNYVADFLDGTITRSQFWALAKFRRPTQQIAFCTSEALKRLTFRSSEALRQ